MDARFVVRHHSRRIHGVVQSVECVERRPEEECEPNNGCDQLLHIQHVSDNILPSERIGRETVQDGSDYITSNLCTNDDYVVSQERFDFADLGLIPGLYKTTSEQQIVSKVFPVVCDNK